MWHKYTEIYYFLSMLSLIRIIHIKKCLVEWVNNETMIGTIASPPSLKSLNYPISASNLPKMPVNRRVTEKVTCWKHGKFSWCAMMIISQLLSNCKLSGKQGHKCKKSDEHLLCRSVALECFCIQRTCIFHHHDFTDWLNISVYLQLS